MKTKRLKIIGASLALIFALVPQTVLANSANVYVSPSSSSVTRGSNVTVQVRINSGTDEMNAAGARINFNSSRLQYVGYSAGDFTQVNATPGSGYFEFSGATLGSTVSGDKRIFSVTFKSLLSGSAPLSISNAQAANAGTALSITTAGGNVSVNDPAPAPDPEPEPVPAPAPSPPADSSADNSEEDQAEEEKDEEEDKPVKIDYKVRITDQNGRPLKNHPVELHSDPLKATTDDDGWAVFESIDPGDHTLVFELDGLVLRWPVEVGQPLELAEDGATEVEDEVELPVRFAEEAETEEETDSNPLVMLITILSLSVLGVAAVLVSVRHYYRRHKHLTESESEE